MSESEFVDKEGRGCLLLATCSWDKSIKIASLCIDTYDLLQPIVNLPNIHTGKNIKKSKRII